jgi:hypothetical protein
MDSASNEDPGIKETWGLFRLGGSALTPGFAWVFEESEQTP